MKKLFISMSLLLAVAYAYAAFIPTAGVKYSLYQNNSLDPSNSSHLNVGAVASQPSLVAPSNSPSQAFEFIPVAGKPDTYYLKNGDNTYLNEKDGWTTIFETSFYELHSEWVIVGDAANSIRLRSNFTNNYLSSLEWAGNGDALGSWASVSFRTGLFSLTTPFETPFVPTPGVEYNIVQNTSSLKVGVGSIATQPAVVTASSSSSQAFKFIPVSGKADTYYLKNGDNNYLNQSPANSYDVVYEASTNGINSEWYIVGANANNIRLMQNKIFLYLGGTDNLYSSNSFDLNYGVYTLTVTGTPTGLDRKSAGNLNALVYSQTADIMGTNVGDLIKVYNVSGSLIKQLTANSSVSSIHLKSGIYIVRVNASVLKVVL